MHYALMYALGVKTARFVGSLSWILCVHNVLIFIECPEGKYGIYCVLNCTCQNGATCDKKNGKCDCAPGYEGNDCEKGNNCKRFS